MCTRSCVCTVVRARVHQLQLCKLRHPPCSEVLQEPYRLQGGSVEGGVGTVVRDRTGREAQQRARVAPPTAARQTEQMARRPCPVPIKRSTPVMVAKKGVSKHRGGTLDVVLQGVSVPALLSALQGNLWRPLGRRITFYVLLWPRILSWLRTEAEHAVAWLFQPLLGRHNRGWLPSILRHYAVIKRYQAILGEGECAAEDRALARPRCSARGQGQIQALS